jgi:hypothetical protein
MGTWFSRLYSYCIHFYFLLKFVSKLSLGSPGVYQMGFPSSSSLKEFLGMELCKTFWLCYVYGILVLSLFDFAACTKGLFLFGVIRFHVS